ncbi:MAG TPA: hypothetical protein VKA34_09760 [Balneolales bacterium]|nr:hypothetical protein [Balneolales bacterium]
MASGGIIGTKTKSNFQFRLAYRGALGFYYYQGKEFIKNDDHPDGSVISKREYVGGAELGLDLNIGFRPT